jgi:hypothetical protein
MQLLRQQISERTYVRYHVICSICIRFASPYIPLLHGAAAFPFRYCIILLSTYSVILSLKIKKPFNLIVHTFHEQTELFPFALGYLYLYV